MSNDSTIMTYTDSMLSSDLQLAIQHQANLIHHNSTMPAHIRNNFSVCWEVITKARNWQLEPSDVARKTSVISDQLCYEGQLLHSAILNMNVVQHNEFTAIYIGDWTPLIGNSRWGKNHNGKDAHVPNWTEEQEKGVGIKITATLTNSVNPLELELYINEIPRRNRKSQLWATCPKQQIWYTAIRYWIRRHCPQVILGCYTPDEIREKEINPQASKGKERNFWETVVQQEQQAAEDAQVIEAEVVPEKKPSSRDFWQQATTKPDEPPICTDTVFDKLKQAIHECTDTDSLTDVGTHIKVAVDNFNHGEDGINPKQRSELGMEYLVKQRELREVGR